ncbi:MAG TPA: acyl-CoA dehydrogenase family protein [Chitinophagales bacterium]|nr:acyl-CoA dehydrogenase family protein [Chitinophagales bacterium]
MNFQPSDKAVHFQTKVRNFIDENILPVEQEILDEIRLRNAAGDWTKWKVSDSVKSLKLKAKTEGLWNLFLPDSALGPGLTNAEYAIVAEEMGRSILAPDIFNCNAPDTGNMEVLWKYGTNTQKSKWLQPLLNGEIRSAFCMTEPDVASSDATNMEASAMIQDNEIVINGRKWWTTGIGHPDCKIIIFMGKTFSDTARHQQHSMVLVPVDTPGVKIERMLTAFGEYDEPYGHGEVTFKNVRLPLENMIYGAGRGFEIAQGRLGPGRIHHCMRCIGAAERTMELLINRAKSRVAFGKPIIELGANREKIADLRIAIDQARLLTLYAAWRIDEFGASKSMMEISQIKVVAPNVLQKVVDEAIQIFGGMGVSNDVPLAAFFAQARCIRIADGPDAVHRNLIAKLELKKYK